MEATFYIPKNDEKFLHLTRPVVFFDLETTGTNPATDRIVELYAIKVAPDGAQAELHYLVNPTISIPAGATAVHGITDEMVADKPAFRELADEVALFFQHCDLASYNIRRFDVPLLMEEFHRCKKYPINCNEAKVVDVMGIYHSKEKRDLSAAVRFYCQREHAGAHSARADVQATIDILKKQLLLYDDLEPNTSFLHDYVNAGHAVDFSGKFVRDERGRIVFNFGMHRGKEACKEQSYLKWMFETGEFSVDTKMVAKKIYMHCVWEEEIGAWLKTNKLTATKELASALYTTVKFGEGIFPFASQKEAGKTIITFLTEPPSSFTLVHPEAVKVMLDLLDQFLRRPGNG